MSHLIKAYLRFRDLNIGDKFQDYRKRTWIRVRPAIHNGETYNAEWTTPTFTRRKWFYPKEPVKPTKKEKQQ